MFNWLKIPLFAAVVGVTLTVITLKEVPQQVYIKGIVGTIGNTTIYNFTSEIKPDGYGDFIELLNKAKTGDEIKVIINSPGGSLNRTLQIEYAMQNTKAKISCEVKQWAASGAASVLLNCGTIKLNDKSLILFHLPYIDELKDDEDYKMRSALTNEGFYDYMNATYGLKEFLGEHGNKKFMLGFDVIITKEFFERNKDKLNRPRFGFSVQGHN